MTANVTAKADANASAVNRAVGWLHQGAAASAAAAAAAAATAASALTSLNFAFNLSMMTQIDEINNDRIF